jgi:flagella basal body P-ring formation protein FlgA
MRSPRTASRIAVFVAAGVTFLQSTTAADGAVATACAGEPVEERVRAAIGRMVLERLRQPATVSVDVLRLEIRRQAEQYAAIAAPGARIGKPVRFVLRANGSPAGYAVAKVDVSGRVAIATRALSRGASITPSDVDWVTRTLADEPFDRLPDKDEIVTASPRRTIAPLEALTFRNVFVPPVVRTGDRITATVRFDGIEVAGEVVASGSGHVGDTIRVLTPQGLRRAARITAPGEVEILQ